jgi:hypothetical protein
MSTRSHFGVEGGKKKLQTHKPLMAPLLKLSEKSCKNKMNTITSVNIVVRVPGYRSRGPGSIPGATRFSE